MKRERQMSETQVAAYEKLIEHGGDSGWVKSSDVGHHQTIKSLLDRRLVQVTEIEGYQHVALAGIVIGNIEEEEL